MSDSVVKSSDQEMIILSKKDQDLTSLLEQLGVFLDGRELTKESVEKADLSFDFFQSFASLTQLTTSKRGPLKQNGALQLLYEAAPEAPVTSKRLEKKQKREDGRLDKDEITALKAALQILDQKEIDEFQLSSKSLSHPDLVKRRLSEITNDFNSSCWLAPEAMRLGLFGHLNGELTYTVLHEPEYSHMGWQMPEPKVLDCNYLPAMGELNTGLYFPFKQMPHQFREQTRRSMIHFQASAGSGIMPRGTGVMVDYPYILTAKHVVESAYGVSQGTDSEGRPSVGIYLFATGGEPIAFRAEVLEIPWEDSTFEEGFEPDLALLYIPNQDWRVAC